MQDYEILKSLELTPFEGYQRHDFVLYLFYEFRFLNTEDAEDNERRNDIINVLELLVRNYDYTIEFHLAYFLQSVKFLFVEGKIKRILNLMLKLVWE